MKDRKASKGFQKQQPCFDLLLKRKNNRASKLMKRGINPRGSVKFYL